MAQRNIQAFGNSFDLVVGRAGDKLQVEVYQSRGGKLLKSLSAAEGGTAMIDLATNKP